MKNEIAEVKWTEQLVQMALTRRGNLFDFTRYTCVPNVSYALLYRGEADLICMSRGNIFHEVEIKISVADMRNEIRKTRSNSGYGYGQYIAYKWIAAPTEIAAEALTMPGIPITWGVVSVQFDNGRYRCKKLRNPKRQKTDKIPESKIIAFYRTGVMRMWSRMKCDIAEVKDNPAEKAEYETDTYYKFIQLHPERANLNPSPEWYKNREWIGDKWVKRTIEPKHYWCPECDYYFDSTDFQTANNKLWVCCPRCSAKCEECE